VDHDRGGGVVVGGGELTFCGILWPPISLSHYQCQLKMDGNEYF